MTYLKMLCLAMGLAAILTGCASNQSSQSSSSPTVSGYISTGAQAHF